MPYDLPAKDRIEAPNFNRDAEGKMTRWEYRRVMVSHHGTVQIKDASGQQREISGWFVFSTWLGDIPWQAEDSMTIVDKRFRNVLGDVILGVDAALSALGAAGYEMVAGVGANTADGGNFGGWYDLSHWLYFKRPRSDG